MMMERYEKKMEKFTSNTFNMILSEFYVSIKYINNLFHFLEALVLYNGNFTLNK